MQIADLAEHTRLLGEVAPALNDLHAEVEQVRKGEIAKPVREIAPISLRVQELAMQCTRQFHDLSVSQYAAMKGGDENLAHLASACSQISLAATLCNLAIHLRTEILLYEDADPTPAASRDQLRRAGDEMKRAATTYRAVAQQLSRRLASAAARSEDQQLIAHALADVPERASAAPRPTPLPAPVAQPTAHIRR
ncbi:hypothetical protein ABT288_12355 [Streptomyces sp. NPDC001093]|uniref:hypothetical protein n=1 Tax=Streptomyces sp. NPDC001093 TaxID=3154376 RepID=UPI0033207D55